MKKTTQVNSRFVAAGCNNFELIAMGRRKYVWRSHHRMETKTKTKEYTRHSGTWGTDSQPRLGAISFGSSQKIGQQGGYQSGNPARDTGPHVEGRARADSTLVCCICGASGAIWCNESKVRVYKGLVGAYWLSFLELYGTSASSEVNSKPSPSAT